MTEKAKLELVDSPPDSVFDDIEALRKTATIKVSRRVVHGQRGGRQTQEQRLFPVPPGPGDVAGCVGPDRRRRIGRFLFRLARRC